MHQNRVSNQKSAQICTIETKWHSEDIHIQTYANNNYTQIKNQMRNIREEASTCLFLIDQIDTEMQIETNTKYQWEARHMHFTLVAEGDNRMSKWNREKGNVYYENAEQNQRNHKKIGRPEKRVKKLPL